MVVIALAKIGWILAVMGDYLREGLRLHYAVRGRGPPLILFNHSGASARGWHEAFLDALALDRTLLLLITGALDNRRTGPRPIAWRCWRSMDSRRLTMSRLRWRT